MVQTATIFLPDDSLTSDLKRELNELDELTQQTEKAFFNLGSYDF
jgi:hypothetical protein